ncbi:YciI family protein [Rhodococcus sp. 5A-K4]|uniref:YciI family protein n=1 Tax=Rhodococcus TaxID=1827 RepID=UPI00355BA6D8
MPYFIETLDKPNSHDIRIRMRPEHLVYLEQHRHLLLASGAKLSDDGIQASGGIYIVDTDCRKEAEEFIQADPFSMGSLFTEVRIIRWRKAYFNFKSFLPDVITP